MKFSISWIVALLAGLLVLVGYFLPPDSKYVQYVQLNALRAAMLVAAFSVLVGVLNLLAVHWRRFDGEHKGGGYSVALIIAFLLPIAAAGIDLFTSPGPTAQPFGLLSQWVFEYLLVPIEATLFAVVAVILVYFAARMLRWRANPFALIFFGTVVFTLVITSPYLASMPDLRNLYENFLRPLSVGGGRGILLGVALGTIATGIRILMGVERPYG